MYRKLIDNTAHRKKTTGFTLSETVVASVILIVAIVPILKNLTIAHVNSVLIERKSYSLTLAQAKLNEIKARSIYHYDNSFAETNSSLSGSCLCNISDDQADPLRTIAVSVGYDSNSDSVLSTDEIMVTLTTYIARRW